MFEEYTGTKEFDGGYTRVNEYEKTQGWGVVPKEEKECGTEYGTLCPTCYLLYKQTLKIFWDADIRAESQEIHLT